MAQISTDHEETPPKHLVCFFPPHSADSGSEAHALLERAFPGHVLVRLDLQSFCAHKENMYFCRANHPDTYKLLFRASPCNLAATVEYPTSMYILILENLSQVGAFRVPYFSSNSYRST